MQSIDYYHRLISLLPGSALVLDLQGQVYALNHSANELLEQPSPLPFSLLDLIAPESVAAARAFLRRCAQSNQPVVGKIVLAARVPDAAYVCHGALLEPRNEQSEPLIFLRLQPTRESNLKFQALQIKIEALNNEIIRRNKAEQALQSQTSYLQVILNSIEAGVIVTDGKGKITLFNPAAERLTGWDSTEALGQDVEKVFQIVDERSASPLNNPVTRAYLTQSIVSHTVNMALLHKDNGQSTIEFTSAPIADPSSVEGVVTVFHDVTKKYILEQELQQRAEKLALMDERKNQFLTMLAHELRAPIAPISFANQVLQTDTVEPALRIQSVQVIERQVSHLKRLIDDMLDVSRITSGKMNIVKQRIDLIEVIQGVCQDLTSQCEAAGITCQCELPTDPIWVDADADRLIQVLYNVIFNAIKFTPSGGKITLSVTLLETSVEITVKDTGTGIEPAALNDLFEPFIQAEQQLDRSAGGLGLGLSLVKGIVELHDGTVQIHSDGIGYGTQITFRLPRENAHATVDQPIVQTNTVLSHRILLIEDDEDTAQMMTQLLQMKGHEVHYASSGPSGVALAKAIQPTFIFCDIGLPEMDGFEVVTTLRQYVDTAKIPIVALSGYGDTDFVNRAFAVGFNLHITKPASLHDLEQALRSLPANS